MSALNQSRAAMLRPEPFESDEDYAYRLQLLEAMTASMSLQPFSSTQPPLNGAGSSSSSHSQHPLGVVREILDRNFGKKSSFERGESSRNASHDKEVCRVYVKGILMDEENPVSKSRIVGIGVAIYDERDVLLFEMSNPVQVMEGECMNNRGVAAKALIEGLNAAVDLGLKKVVCFCDDYPLYKMVTRRWSPKQDKLVKLLNEVQILRKNFTNCRTFWVARNELKYAFKLAREAVASQTNKHAESSGKTFESCVICLEDVDVYHIFSVDGCMHRYCFSCMNQHVEVKLLNSMVPKCPHDGCPSDLKLDSCQKFLRPKLFDIMSERLKEGAIPVKEKIYCPYPRCSALMSRATISEYTRTQYPGVHKSGARKCIKCHGLFCVNCKVPWHHNMTCYAFKLSNSSQDAEDVKLKTLAAQNQWRQCVKCNHMIELAKGCYHMTCRCGYEFCYTCGSEWKNKKATCTCPLWDESYIIDDDNDDDENGESEEEIDNFDDYFDYNDNFDSDSDVYDWPR